MPKNNNTLPVDEQNLFMGIADFDKLPAKTGEVAFMRSIENRLNPREIKLLPKTTKEAALDGLPKWFDRVADTVYFIDSNGNLYSRSLAGSVSKIRTIADNHGNGLSYYGEDGYLYYPNDRTIGRYGPFFSTPVFADDFLGSEGGVPLNKNSLVLASASSQYLYYADDANLSITGDLTFEIDVKPTTLPAVGATQTLISKWNEQGNLRSYRFDIVGTSLVFGSGSDGALTISADTTDSPIDSACSGTSGTNSLTATNANFATGQKILIIQMQGTNAGTWQRNEIQSYSAGTITLTDNLNADYSSSGSNTAQVLVLKQYTDVTVNSGKTWTAKAWNGTVGGILAFLANGAVAINGTISASGKGFRGGIGAVYNAGVGALSQCGYDGESSTGPSSRSIGGGYGDQNSNGAGGGGSPLSSSNRGGGGGGGNATSGGDGKNGGYLNAYGGTTNGSADLTTFCPGAGGGGGGTDSVGGAYAGDGGAGGGGIIIYGLSVTVNNSTGNILTNGNDGSGSHSNGGCGGAGSGGDVLIRTQTATLNTTRIVASGGTGGSGGIPGESEGGNGGNGRIHLDYSSSYTGTTTPTLDVTQDGNLTSSTQYQLRLSVSNDGTAVENLAKNVDLTTGNWNGKLAVSWDASASLATFYIAGVKIGTVTGSKTAIHDNASQFFVGTYKNGSGTATAFLNAAIDDIRIFNLVRSDSEINNNKAVILAANTSGLVAYYHLDGNLDDSTSNALNLTGSGSPTYSADVPFSSPTSRQDLDQELNTSGNTYTTPTAISETSAADRQDFVPAKDPQKSIEVLVAAKGTGNWTLTVHDGLNRVVATKTVTNANMHTGDFEFIFSDVWRPIIGATYHFHITSTVNDGTVTTTTAGDLNTVDFHTYYQFLVTDTQYHPICSMLNFKAIANERYLATYSASGGYNPHRLTLPSGYKMRCMTQWKDYLVMGFWKGNSVYDEEQGLLVFWNGQTKTYNFYIEVPEGAINAILSTRGVLYVWAGYRGDLLEYNGSDSAMWVKRIPKMKPDKYIELYPGAVTMYQSMLRFGVAANTDSTDIEKGVYTYGDIQGQASLTYDYPISTGNRLSTVKIGGLYATDRKLLIGWEDGASYGLDVVDPTGDCFASGTVESLISDKGMIWKDKMPQALRVELKEPLTTGQSVTIKYKLDRASGWTSLTESTVGATSVQMPLQTEKRYKEIQKAIDLNTTSGISPIITEFSVKEDLLADEDNYV